VLGVHDYFLDQSVLDSNIDTVADVDNLTHAWLSRRSVRLPEGDRWALPFVSASRVQPIQEFCDIDGAGFISINEVNKFTSSKPKGWRCGVPCRLHPVCSLQRLWHQLTTLVSVLGIRFVCVFFKEIQPSLARKCHLGWHMSVWYYREQIQCIIRAMFALLPDVLPANLTIVDDYMESRWFKFINILLQSVKPYSEPPSEEDKVLWDMIQPYVHEEEAKLEANLEAVDWVVDESRNLDLVTGTTRTEHVSMPSLTFVSPSFVILIFLHGSISSRYYTSS
jgi:hypothetical protein